MSHCKKFSGIERSEFNRLKEDLAKEGIAISDGDRGEVTGAHNIRISWEFTEVARALEICLCKHPWYIPAGEIWKYIDAGVAPYVG